jgi:O-antigen ligase
VTSAIIALAAFVLIPDDKLFVFQASRAQGLLKDPNVFGPFMAPAILMVVEEIVRPRLLRMGTLAKTLIVLLLTVALVLSFSRAAWLNLGVGMIVLLAVLLLRRERGSRMAMVVGIVAVCAVATTAVVFASGESNFISERAQLQGYDAERFDAQEAGIGLAETHPLGIGPGQFEAVVQYSAHSTYIRSFAEQGPLGLFTMVVLVLGTLVLALRNVAVGRSAYGIGSAALLAAWCGLLVNSLFVDTLHWRHFWLVAALIWVAASRTEREPPPADRALPG